MYKYALDSRTSKLAEDGKIDAGTRDSVLAMLSSSDPKTIWAVSGLRQSVNGTTLGKDLLLNSRAWKGELDLRDERSMKRFHSYVG